ncbi:MAG: cupredoxin domain-containing protein [Ilumatobacteraceae bacterium]|nr:cupredoxin domain-containing protein [Ilumatobacteraceae bacterium]
MKKFTPTLLICAAGALISGVALARPADDSAVVSSEYESSPVAADSARIQIEGFAFTEAPSVDPGTQIVVSNDDGAAHTLTSDDGLFDTGDISGGASASITAPQEAGTYSFVCLIHPSMTGELTVSG